MSELKTKLNKALHGIDLDQCESDTGYWETSCGVEFGKSVLVKVNNIADGYERQLEEDREKASKLRVGIREAMDWLDCDSIAYIILNELKEKGE